MIDRRAEEEEREENVSRVSRHAQQQASMNPTRSIRLAFRMSRRRCAAAAHPAQLTRKSVGIGRHRVDPNRDGIRATSFRVVRRLIDHRRHRRRRSTQTTIPIPRKGPHGARYHSNCPLKGSNPISPVMPRPSASTPHLIWAAGHFLCFFAGLRYLAGTLMFATSSGGLSRWYTATYVGAIISYCVVVYKSFGVPQANKAYIQRALMDENVQYLFLALYWFMSKPIFITLVPFVTFSLFHVLTFLRTTVIPIVFPSASPAPGANQAAAGGAPAASPSAPPAKIAKFVQGWVKANYDPAMRFVAYAEVAIFGRVLFGALLFRNSLMAPLFYAHFLRLRFYMSSFTRAAFQHVKSILDGYTQHQSCPPVVRKAYLTLTDLISRYASSVLSVQNAGAQQPAAAGAGAGGAGAAGGAAAAAAAPRR